MFSYEVVVLPALWFVFALTTATFLFQGITRTTREVEGVQVGKYGYEGRYARRAGLTAIIGALVLLSLVVTPPGHRGVIYSATGGVSATERGEGLSFVVPIFQTAKQISVREQRFFTETGFTQSKDLQEITVHLAVGWQIIPTRAAELYQEVGAVVDVATVLVIPAIGQFLTQEVGLIEAEDFALSRAALAASILAELRVELEPQGINVLYVAVEDAVFDSDFIASVKAKIIAEQNAIAEFNNIAKAENLKQQVIKTAEGDAQRRFIEAEGEHRAIEEVATALGFTPGEYLVWLRVNAWNGEYPTTLLGGADDLSIILDGIE